jgi:hypothetical protein
MGMGRKRRLIASAVPLIATALVSVTPGSPAVAQSARATSPQGQVLVVTNNLQEAFKERDLRRMGEVRNFTERLVDQVPYAPDVVLLQEVRRKSAAFVAERLTALTGSSFVLAKDPGPDPWYEVGRRVIKKETAIVINADTMRKTGAGGFLSQTHARSDGAPGHSYTVKKTAYLPVAERGDGLELGLASAHFHLDNLLRSKEIARRYKKRWSVQIARLLKNKYPSHSASEIHVWGGDLNAARCVDPKKPYCALSPFWKTITRAPYNYIDTVYRVALRDDNVVEKRTGHTDYIFSKGRAITAGSDLSYKSELRSNPDIYYSDHRFYWAVVGPKS